MRPAELVPKLNSGQDLVLLLTRLAVGLFLIHGVLDNVLSPARMAEFAAFLDRFGFVPAQLWAPVSVYAQLLAGVSLVVGLGARVAGGILVVNFLVALIMVDAQNGVRAAFPALALVLFGLLVASFGAGRYSLDRLAAKASTDQPASER